MSNRLLFGEPTSLAIHDVAAGWSLSWGDVRAAWRRYRTRQRIADLDSHLLKDIGVTPFDAEIEANKPFWRL
jgi:uncharacterized protein YjiS (DUF1127 family)